MSVGLGLGLGLTSAASTRHIAPIVPVNASFTDHGEDTSDSATYTFSGKSIGAADAARVLYIGAHARSGSNITIPSMTVDGAAATLVASQQSTGTIGQQACTAWFSINKPTGTTATIVITISASAVRAGIVIYSTTSPGTVVISSSNANPFSTSLLTIDNGTALGYSGAAITAGTPAATWTGLNEDLDIIIEGTEFHSAAHLNTPTGGTVSMGVSWSGTVAGVASILLVISPAGADGWANQIWAGALTDTGVSIQADLSSNFTTNLVIAAAADTTFTDPIAIGSGPTVVTDAGGGASFYSTIQSVVGLTPNTSYRYGLRAPNGVIITNSVGLFKTLPNQGSPASFAFCHGSCSNFTNGTGAPFGPDTCQALDNIAAEADSLFMIQQGDLIYDDLINGSLTSKRSNNKFVRCFRSSSSGRALSNAMPVAYTWSDHDSTTNDATLSTPGYATQIGVSTQVYQETVPSYPLGDTATLGIAQSWWVGTCFFIAPDCYSFRNSAGSPPPMLGSQQYDWVVSQIDAAVVAGATLIFFISSPTWTNSPYLGWNPTWATEQTALLNDLKAISGLPGICVIEGDNHKSGADDGTNTDFSTGGGMKIIRLLSSPLKQSGTLSGGGPCSWNGVVNTDTTDTRVYCRVDVNAANTGLIATFKGRASGDGAFAVVNGPFNTDDLAGW